MADTALPDWVKLLNLPAKDAAEWFRKLNPIASASWSAIAKTERDYAFTIAGMLREDLLKTVFEKLGQAIEDGRDATWFEKQLKPILQRAGWWGDSEEIDPETGAVTKTALGSPTRLKFIFDTNVRRAEAAGRWQQAERVKSTAPFMMRRTMGDERVREDHAIYDYVCLPIDDPFWDDHCAPMAFGCRCQDINLSEDGIQDYIDAGLPIKRKAPADQFQTFERDGETIKLPLGVAPGFGRNPVSSRANALKDTNRRKRATLPPSLSKEAKRVDRKPK